MTPAPQKVDNVHRLRKNIHAQAGRAVYVVQVK